MSPAFAMLGGFATAITIVVSLTGAIIVGAYVLAYAAHSLLTIVEATGAGEDVVHWPDIPIPDWIDRGIYLGALLLICIAPGATLSRSLRNDWLVDDPGLRFVLLAVPGLWLFFPISLLSSMSASSRWIIFRISIVAVLFRILPSTLLFYGLSAGALLGTAAVWYLTICKEGGMVLILVAAPVGAAAILFYARLLGRLSLLIHRLNPSKEERDAKPRKKKKRRPEVQEEDEAPDEPQPIARQKPRPPVLQDPELDLPAPLVADDAADEPEDDEFPLLPLERDEAYDKRWTEEVDDGPATPYDLDSAAQAKTPNYRPIEDYDIDDMGPQAPEEQRTGGGVVAPLDRPRKRKFKPAAPVVIGPAHPWLQGLYSFPFYATSLGALTWLSLGLMIVGLCCGLLVANYPTGE